MSKTVQAIHRAARISPMKIRPLTFSIVGKSATEAVDILTFMPRKGARMMLKVLKSAIANAENNHNLSSATLFVQEAHVDDAPVLKRFMPAARGSAHPIHKRSSHIRIVLAEGKVEKAIKDRTNKSNKTNRSNKEKAKKAEAPAKTEGKAE